MNELNPTDRIIHCTPEGGPTVLLRADAMFLAWAACGVKMADGNKALHDALLSNAERLRKLSEQYKEDTARGALTTLANFMGKRREDHVPPQPVGAAIAEIRALDGKVKERDDVIGRLTELLERSES